MLSEMVKDNTPKNNDRVVNSETDSLQQSIRSYMHSDKSDNTDNDNDSQMILKVHLDLGAEKNPIA